MPLDAGFDPSHAGFDLRVMALHRQRQVLRAILASVAVVLRFGVAMPGR